VKKHNLKILFVGVLDVSWSTNIEMRNALLQLGCQVKDFNYRSLALDFCPAFQKNLFFRVFLTKLFSFFRRFEWLPFGLPYLYFGILGRKKMNDVLRSTISLGDFDLVLLAKTDTVDYRMFDKLRKIPTWYFFMDPPEQAHKVNVFAYAKRTSFSSATFSSIAAEASNNGIKMTHLMQGYDPGKFYPNIKNAKKNIDVIFAGTKTKKREIYIKSLINSGISVSVFGKGWGKNEVFGESLANLYRESKIILNFVRDGGGFSVRLFQAMACGSFVLSEYCFDFDSVFEKEEHLDWFQSNEDLISLVKKYLKNESLREKIAVEGASRVNEKHTWDFVMQQLLDDVVAEK
jgi:hypothetical protein